MNCIFCKEEVGSEHEEHILPESLGGKDWAVLPEGLVCEKCNQYFGAKVESAALSSFPFLPFRLFLQIPTKRGKAPRQQVTIGEIMSSGIPGVVGANPRDDEIETGIREENVTQMRIRAEVTEPLAVSRLLLKMGLEVVAADNAEDALSEKFDGAKKFVRAPATGSEWWFLMVTDHDSLFCKLKQGVTCQEWFEDLKLEVVDEQGAEVFHLQLIDMHFITPLERRVGPPDMSDLSEPKYRLFNPVC